MAVPEDPDIAAPTVLAMLARGSCALGPDSSCLSPAPLYHAAPLRWSMTVQRLGGTVAMMRHFEPAAALAAIARRIVASQWVPTYFVRMPKLPEAERTAHDPSSLSRAELSGVKTPRQIDFAAELPRHATGKPCNRLLRDGY